MDDDSSPSAIATLPKLCTIFPRGQKDITHRSFNDVSFQRGAGRSENGAARGKRRSRRDQA